VPLASRRSVHCKSDITHKLNRHEVTPEDILHTLHDSRASKVLALLDKGQLGAGHVLLIGGVTQNAAMVAALRGKRPETDFVARPESAWLEALGCALLVRDEPRSRKLQIAVPHPLDRLPPHSGYAAQVRATSSRSNRAKVSACGLGRTAGRPSFTETAESAGENRRVTSVRGMIFATPSARIAAA